MKIIDFRSVRDLVQEVTYGLFVLVERAVGSTLELTLASPEGGV